MDSMEAFYKVTYGLYIITASHEGKQGGYVGNTVFQVTADPPQFAISCSKDNASLSLIKKSGYFAVSVLDKQTKIDLIGTFGYKSSRDIEKFEGVDYIKGSSGCPIVLEDCLAWFECKVTQAHDLGSHLLFIGEIINKDLLKASKSPLTYAYYQTELKGRAPKNAPTYIEKKESGIPVEATAASKYKCLVCGHVYDPAEGDEDSGIPPGTAFEDLPDDWVCPLCGAEKSDFEPLED